MKIAFINIYQDKVDRGAETFVKEVADRLSDKHQVIIIKGKGNFTQYKRWPLFWRFFLDPQSLSIFWFTLKNLPLIYKEKYDVVIPLNGGWQPALIRLVTWLYRGKMVIAGQSGVGWDDRNNLWSFPDCFVALSSFAKNWARKVNPFVDVEYIPNGVDIGKFGPNGRKIKTNLQKPIVLCVGALTKTKRIGLTIEAVARLNNVSLMVVGDGVLKEEIKRLGEKKLHGRFELFKVPYKEMMKVYRVADVFTIPSAPYYSFEIVITEAMATNLPIVANCDPIRKEIVGDAGILTDPTNAELFSQAIKKALTIRWGNRPREQAKKFSWDEITIKYDRLFRKLIK